MSETFCIPKGASHSQVDDVCDEILRQSARHRVKVVVEMERNTRSDQQNRYLWGVAYPAILKHLPGWDADDVHEFCLGEWSGWELMEGLGRRRLRPVRRSSKLSTVEFMDFVEHIQRTMSEKGIDVPSPNEEVAA